MSTSDHSSPATSSRAAAKARRALACVLCQQRKIKCDHKTPCTACAKAGVQCVPADLTPRQRRRRLPERELLERLRRYEGLLRQNNIDFDPLHPSSGPGEVSFEVNKDGNPSNAGVDVDSFVHVRTKKNGLGNTLNAMRPKSRTSEADYNSDDGESPNENVGSFYEIVDKTAINQAWERMHEHSDGLLLGMHTTDFDLSALHPKQVHIFKLWQIYLDNVDPLLKVTHSPTLQARVIDAASDVGSIPPTLEALMFSIYCVSIASLVEEEKVQALFGATRKDLLASYQFGCQQALLNCGLLRTDDRECLTAYYLYLISLGPPTTDPRYLSSMLAVAVRIAQRMGIHDESTYTKLTTFEAEMRRRLWWALIIYDNRICEMSDFRTTSLSNSWSCIIPLNVNDYDLRPEMTTRPAASERPTEALFSVVRCELGWPVHLSTPKHDVKHVSEGNAPESSKLNSLEKKLEAKYLQFCNPENPLHLMTICWTRGLLAKKRLYEYYSLYSRSTVQATDMQRDITITWALSALECDTKLMSSPLTKRYTWLIGFHFPFPAHIHILEDMKKRPSQKHAEKAWEVMSDNYQVRFMKLDYGGNPLFKESLFKIFSGMVLEAWEAYKAAATQDGRSPEPLLLVADVKRRLAEMASQSTGAQQPSKTASTSIDEPPISASTPSGDYGVSHGLNDFSMSTAMDLGGQDQPHAFSAQDAMGFGTANYSFNLDGQVSMDFQPQQLDWTTMGWDPMDAQGWWN